MIALSSINKAVVFPFNLPAVAELGTASGFDMELLDNGNLGHEKLTRHETSCYHWQRNRLTRSPGYARTAWKIRRCSK